MFPKVPFGLFTIPLKLHSAVPLGVTTWRVNRPSIQYSQKTGARFLRRLEQLSTLYMSLLPIAGRSGPMGSYRATILTCAE